MSIADDKRFMSRFEAGKGPQIEQLISYVTLLGLSGSDLIAVGGKMNREIARQKRIDNDNVIATYKIEKIGKDININHTRRFKIRTIDSNYNVEHTGWNACTITNTTTKVKKSFTYIEKPISAKGYHWTVKQMILAIAYGEIKLDF